MKISRPLSILVCALLMAGCSTLKVRVDRRPEVALQRQIRELLTTTPTELRSAQWLAYSRNDGLTEDQRLEALLSAAKTALPEAVANLDSEDAKIYSIAVREVVSRLIATNFRDVVLSDGREVTSLTVSRGGKDGAFDPQRADSIYPADSVTIRGIINRITVAGIGVPYVAIFKQGNPYLEGNPGVPRFGLTIPLTATLRFTERAAEIVFQDPTDNPNIVLNRKTVPVAADFSAPLAFLIAKGPNRSLDPRALIMTGRNMKNAGLFQVAPYDPNKIPVVFVHGLLARPEAWTRATNELFADPVIRERYQFWYFLYPTGLPVWASATILRRELDRFRSAVDPDTKNPRLDEKIVVGHSMGGLISNLLIRKGGNKLWRQFSDRDLETIQLTPRLHEVVNEIINFSPREDIKRVIFVATPHQGSPLALRPLAGFVAQFIQLPKLNLLSDRAPLLAAIRQEVRGLFMAPANSIQFLRAESPILRAILNLPLSDRVEYHTIIGDRGRGDSPLSSDGVVPYWSSSLPGAYSEKIVPSNHGANEHPEGIEEIRRVLVEAAR